MPFHECQHFHIKIFHISCIEANSNHCMTEEYFALIFLFGWIHVKEPPNFCVDDLLLRRLPFPFVLDEFFVRNIQNHQLDEVLVRDLYNTLWIFPIVFSNKFVILSESAPKFSFLVDHHYHISPSFPTYPTFYLLNIQLRFISYIIISLENQNKTKKSVLHTCITYHIMSSAFKDKIRVIYSLIISHLDHMKISLLHFI